MHFRQQLRCIDWGIFFFHYTTICLVILLNVINAHTIELWALFSIDIVWKFMGNAKYFFIIKIHIWVKNLIKMSQSKNS